MSFRGGGRIKTGLRSRPARKPQRRPRLPKPPPEPVPFLAHLKSIPDPVEALDLFLSPSSSSHHTNPVVVSSLLYRLARSRLFSPPHLPSLLRLARSNRIPLRPHLLSSIIRHLGRARLPQEALSLFLRSPRRPLPCLNHTLNALVDNRCLPQARLLLSQHPANVVSYNILLKGVLGEDGLDAALQLLDEMSARRVAPSVATYNALVGHASRSGMVARAFGFKEEAARKGVEPNAVTYALLMEGLCLEGKHAEARKLMFDMEYRGCKTRQVNYGVLMSDCARRGNFEEAKELVAEMRRRRMKPDGVIYSILVNYLCGAGRVDEAYKVHVEMQMEGCEPGAAVYRMMVDGFCQVRDFEGGLRVLNAMLSSGHCPRRETFVCLVSGLCRGGRVEDACFVLEEMAKRKKGLEVEGWGSLVEAISGECDSNIGLISKLTSMDFVEDEE